MNNKELKKHIIKAYKYEQQGLLEKANQEIKYCIGKDDKNAELYNVMGILYGELELWQKSEDAFLKALELNPKINVHLSLGATYLAHGKAKEAITEFLICISAKPNDALAHLQLGFGYYDEHRFTEAAEEMEIALKLNPSFPNVHGCLSEVYEMLGYKEKAQRELEIQKRFESRRH